MATQDNDYNSSDLEVPEFSNPYANAGSANINTILANAGEDRPESKIKSKQLMDNHGAPLSREFRARWLQRFKDFAQGSLRHG